MKTIIKKLLELGAKSTNVKTTLKKIPAPERKRWEGKESFLIQDLEAIERKEELKREKKYISGQAKKHNLTVREYKILTNKAKEILADFHTGHIMGCYKFLYLNGKPFAKNHNIQDYSRSCNYKAIHGRVEIRLNKKEIREIERIGGLWTIKGEKVANKVFESKTLIATGQKSNYDVSFVNGFMTSNYHAYSIGEALSWRKNMAERLVSERRRERNKDKLKDRFVGFRHSINAGNCESGTISFCKRHDLDPKMGYKLDYILSLEDSMFTQRLFSAL